MAEGAKEGNDEGFSFVDKVRLMMYTEQEKEAFLIDKKEKEEKKKGAKFYGGRILPKIGEINFGRNRLLTHSGDRVAMVIPLTHFLESMDTTEAYTDRDKRWRNIDGKDCVDYRDHQGMRTRALSLHQQGWSWTKIATELGCHRTTVMRLVHKWQQTGCIADLPHRRKPRPPQSQQPQQQQQQPQDRLQCPPPLRWMQGEENRRPAARSTTVTVRRRLKELRSQLGILSPPSPKPPLMAPPVCKTTQRTPLLEPCKPLRTLQEISAFSVEELSRIVYSDVRVFVSDREGGARVWRAGRPPPLDSGHALRQFFAGGGLCATFWLCISGSGQKGQLLHVPDELTEERYVQILHNGLLPSAAAIYGLDAHRFLFAQDPSSIQASPSVAAFLRQQLVQCCEWPARGPDCNPCDLLWEELESSMPAGAASSQQELVQRVRRGYEAIEPEYVRWLVAPPRIRCLCRRMMRMRTASEEAKEQ